jgi:hypothetical protein
MHIFCKETLEKRVHVGVMAMVEGKAELAWEEVSSARVDNEHVDWNKSTSKITPERSSGLWLEASFRLTDQVSFPGT